jgi:biotin synthase
MTMIEQGAAAFAGANQPSESADIRHDWTAEEARALLAAPLSDLVFRAQELHRRHQQSNEVEMATLVNIKDGGCPEDCHYCSQSLKWDGGVDAGALMPLQELVEAAKRAKAAGAHRLCMGAAWRSPNERDLAKVCDMVRAVKAEGLETCVTLGMLKEGQAEKLNEAGLDYYNHNLDTSEAFYHQVVTTRTYRDRLETLGRVREAGIKMCCGGILGLGESEDDRAAMLATLARFDPHPESVPVNSLVAIEGTPMSENAPVDEIAIVRMIAAARIMMPKSTVRLAAGRMGMSEAGQALAYVAGANSIFLGEKLLTTPNPGASEDMALLTRLGLSRM